MKNLNEINEQIAACVKASEDLKKSSKDYKRLEKNVSFLNQIKHYLISDPSEDFCVNELKRLNDLKVIIKNANLSNYTPISNTGEVDINKKRSSYENEMRLTNINLQIRVLKFICT